MKIDAREFRDALSSFGTGVTIVTASDPKGEPVGMTASSFNSVSVEPPLVLWSVTKTARSAQVFKDAKHFCVHILGSHQIDTSNKFAKQGEDKFDGIDFSLNDNGVPTLSDYSARFECKTWSVYEGGDHWIIVGEVQQFERKKTEGLLFAGGSYAISTPIQQNKPISETSGEASGEIENMLVYKLSRAYHQLTMEFRTSIKENNLSTPEWRILASIEGEGVQRSLEDLTKMTFIRVDALRDLLHSMQDQELCECERVGSGMNVRATEKGNQAVHRLFEIANTHEQAALSGLNKKQTADLSDSLDIIIGNTNK